MLFPGGRLPLKLFEQRYLDMASACMRAQSPFGVCLIREGAEVGAPATPHEVGTLARIAEWDMQQLGVLQIVAKGEQRFRVRTREAAKDGLLRASVEVLAEDKDSDIPAACAGCVQLLERVLAEHPALVERPHHFTSSAWVSAHLAQLLPLPLALKQALLELDDGGARLERINGFLAES